MGIESLRDLTKDELLQKREEIRQELFNLRMRRGVRGLDNPLKLRVLRREMARIETIISEDSKGIRKIVDQTGLLSKTSDQKNEKE